MQWKENVFTVLFISTQDQFCEISCTYCRYLLYACDVCVQHLLVYSIVMLLWFWFITTLFKRLCIFWKWKKKFYIYTSYNDSKFINGRKNISYIKLLVFWWFFIWTKNKYWCMLIFITFSITPETFGGKQFKEVYNKANQGSPVVQQEFQQDCLRYTVHRLTSTVKSV